MNRRTRRDDGRERTQSSVEFEHLLDSVRDAPAEADAQVEIDEPSPVDQVDPPEPPTVDPPQAVSTIADISINDDLLPAPRRRRWGRR